MHYLISPATRIYDSITYWHIRLLRRRLGLPVYPPHCHHQSWFFPTMRLRQPLSKDVFERRIY